MTALKTLPLEGYLLIGLFGLLLPVIAFRTRAPARALLRGLRPADLPGFYRRQSGVLVVLAIIALLPLATGRATLAGFRLQMPEGGALVLAGSVILVVWLLLGAAIYAVRRQAAFRDWLTAFAPPEVLAMTPKDGRSLTSWALLSLTAGIGEEILYRAALPWALGFLMDPMAALLLSAGAFAAGHLYQGGRYALIVLLFGIGFAAFTLAVGSVLPAMALHMLYDFEVGRLYLVREQASIAAADKAVLAEDHRDRIID